MKIFTPFNSTNMVNSLINAGADELFCGVVYKRWNERFGKDVELNRRSSAGASANLTSMEELAEAIAMAHKLGKRLFLTLNHHQYTNTQLPYIKELMAELKTIGGDGIIVADLNVLEMGKEIGLKVAVSTVLNVYNAETVKLLKDMGADRIILSRDISLEDIRRIREKVSDIEIEVFMLNAPCKFSDSMCLTLHNTQWGNFCRFLNQSDYRYHRFDTKEMSFEEEHTLHLNNFYYHRFFMQRACGICAIWRLLQYKIDACKVVGRFEAVKKVVEDTKMIRQNIEIAKNCKTEIEYIEKIVNPFVELDKCRWGYQCYFPEIRGYSGE